MLLITLPLENCVHTRDIFLHAHFILFYLLIQWNRLNLWPTWCWCWCLSPPFLPPFSFEIFRWIYLKSLCIIIHTSLPRVLPKCCLPFRPHWISSATLGMLDYSGTPLMISWCPLISWEAHLCSKWVLWTISVNIKAHKWLYDGVISFCQSFKFDQLLVWVVKIEQ